MISSVVTSVPMMAVVPTISWLGISRPLAIIMMSVGVRRSITVSVGSVSVRMAVVAISRLGSGGGLGISLSLSISGPLAVVVASVASIASTVPSIASTVPSIASIAIAGLGGNNSEEDDGESNQKFHVVRSSFS